MSESLNILGIMSGSSCDGVDVAICSFDFNGRGLNYKLVDKASFNFSPEMSEDLKVIATKSLSDVNSINSRFSKYLAANIKTFLNSGVTIDYIASHGHTVLHAPDRGYTLQLGSGALISALTGIPTMCDFRSQDIAHGGQGAPLAPLADKHLFDGHDFYLNLGGIANVSYVDDQTVIGFDISPCNQMLNALSKLQGLDYDKAGLISSKGQINDQLLGNLLSNNFLALDYPKSLDNTWVQENYTRPILASTETVEDRLRTTVEFIAIAISNALLQVKDTQKISLNDKTMFCTGGGAFNDFMIERIRFHCKAIGVSLTIPDADVIEYKEAMLMALMGYLRVMDKPNCIASVTGANKDCSAGVIYYP